MSLSPHPSPEPPGSRIEETPEADAELLSAASSPQPRHAPALSTAGGCRPADASPGGGAPPRGAGPSSSPAPSPFSGGAELTPRTALVRTAEYGEELLRELSTVKRREAEAAEKLRHMQQRQAELEEEAEQLRRSNAELVQNAHVRDAERRRAEAALRYAEDEARLADSARADAAAEFKAELSAVRDAAASRDRCHRQQLRDFESREEYLNNKVAELSLQTSSRGAATGTPRSNTTASDSQGAVLGKAVAEQAAAAAARQLRLSAKRLKKSPPASDADTPRDRRTCPCGAAERLRLAEGRVADLTARLQLVEGLRRDIENLQELRGQCEAAVARAEADAASARAEADRLRRQLENERDTHNLQEQRSTQTVVALRDEYERQLQHMEQDLVLYPRRRCAEQRQVTVLRECIAGLVADIAVRRRADTVTCESFLRAVVSEDERQGRVRLLLAFDFDAAHASTPPAAVRHARQNLVEWAASLTRRLWPSLPALNGPPPTPPHRRIAPSRADGAAGARGPGRHPAYPVVSCDGSHVDGAGDGDPAGRAAPRIERFIGRRFASPALAVQRRRRRRQAPAQRRLGRELPGEDKPAPVSPVAAGELHSTDGWGDSGSQTLGSGGCPSPGGDRKSPPRQSRVSPAPSLESSPSWGTSEAPPVQAVEWETEEGFAEADRFADPDLESAVLPSPRAGARAPTSEAAPGAPQCPAGAAFSPPSSSVAVGPRPDVERSTASSSACRRHLRRLVPPAPPAQVAEERPAADSAESESFFTQLIDWGAASSLLSLLGEGEDAPGRHQDDALGSRFCTMPQQRVVRKQLPRAP
eukprot:TRINITY_DN70540_c0_g1_i1.p1 TRINITY_DN70540_c0_g1~~TRINITY_DN70540_c0_g1_i1.p1  ORF type:complete len:844 (+),score=191.73 TRINITY_DN70540_c0_g1_i1:82-2532(+)